MLGKAGLSRQSALEELVPPLYWYLVPNSDAFMFHRRSVDAFLPKPPHGT